MATNGNAAPAGGLPAPKRFITDHDDKGRTTFASSIPEGLPFQPIKGVTEQDDLFSLCYATEQFPVQLTDNADVDVYNKYLENKPGITIRGGTVLRMVDLAPGNKSPMHRTISLDYGVVLEGEVELILDSGETRLLKRGDIAIQRATNHAWRNASKDTWARMLYVLQESAPVTIAGQTLGEDYGGIKGVRASS